MNGNCNQAEIWLAKVTINRHGNFLFFITTIQYGNRRLEQPGGFTAADSHQTHILWNADVMLGQSKNPFQAEIDAPCELIDFLRFSTFYASQVYADQPYSEVGTLNRMEYRALEGFVFSLTPFNFTSIASNLNMAPAMMEPPMGVAQAPCYQVVGYQQSPYGSASGYVY